jgi:hypothetical protein
MGAKTRIRRWLAHLDKGLIEIYAFAVEIVELALEPRGGHVEPESGRSEREILEMMAVSLISRVETHVKPMHCPLQLGGFFLSLLTRSTSSFPRGHTLREDDRRQLQRRYGRGCSRFTMGRRRQRSVYASVPFRGFALVPSSIPARI